jgi:hypothetical protein
MHSLMRTKVDTLYRYPRAAKSGFCDRIWLSQKGQHSAMMVWVCRYIHQPNAWHFTYRLRQRMDGVRVAPFTEIGYTFYHPSHRRENSPPLRYSAKTTRFMITDVACASSVKMENHDAESAEKQLF